MDQLLLIHQVAAGDKKAFGQLYELYHDKVYHVSLSHLHDMGEAEEVTQDVFVEVYHAAESFKAESSVSTWIYRIAVNKCLDRLRYRNRKKRFAFVVNLFRPQSAELKYDVPHFDHPGVAMEHKENASILFKAIDLLPKQQKTAFILTYIEDLPQKEVADVMHLSVKAVESLLQRAKTSLRHKLEDFYPHRRK